MAISRARAEGMTKAELVEAATKRRKGSKKMNATNTLKKSIRDLGKATETTIRVYAATNVPVTLVSGRNLLHPTGFDEGSASSAISIRNPYTKSPDQSTAVMLDVYGQVFDDDPPFASSMPDLKFGTRVKAVGPMIVYNARRVLTKEGFNTSVGASVVGALAARAARPLFNGAANVVGSFAQLAPGGK